jgi:hypothetical protein
VQDADAIWTDSLRPEPSTALFAIRSNEDSTRTSESFRGPVGAGISGEFQRVQPGTWTRRGLSGGSGPFRWRVGDLNPWRDDPFLEGSGRGTGRGTSSESSSLLLGSGRRPNGVEIDGEQEGIEARGRWREERGPRGRLGAGSLRAEFSGISFGLRSERVDSGAARHLGTFGLSGSRGSAWLALDDRFDPGFAFRLDTNVESSNLYASGRWVSSGIHGRALQSGWSGSAATDFGARWRLEDLGGARVRFQALSDSADRTRLRAEVRSWGNAGIHRVEVGGSCTRETRRGLWSGLLLGWCVPKGDLRPELSHSWTDSGNTARQSSMAGIAWRTGGGSLRGQVRWDWSRDRGYALVSRESSLSSGSWKLTSRIQGGRDLQTGRVSGQGSVQCAW